MDEMLALGRNGIGALIGTQRAVLARIMVTPPEENPKMALKFLSAIIRFGLSIVRLPH